MVIFEFDSFVVRLPVYALRLYTNMQGEGGNIRNAPQLKAAGIILLERGITWPVGQKSWSFSAPRIYDGRLI
jgi:hypothetical protein